MAPSRTTRFTKAPRPYTKNCAHPDLRTGILGIADFFSPRSSRRDRPSIESPGQSEIVQEALLDVTSQIKVELDQVLDRVQVRWGPYGNSEEPSTLFSCKLSR